MKTREEQIAGLITPFNLSTEESAELFSCPLPDEIKIAAYLVRMPTACPACATEKYRDVHDEYVELVSGFPKAATNFGISSKVMVDHGLDLGASLPWMLDVPWGRDWEVDGLYTQIGIYNPAIPRQDDPTVAVLAAMHNIDLHVAATGTPDPSKFKPQKADHKLATEFGELINDIYYTRFGIWSRDIIDYRVMMMIKTRALLHGRDPESEYDRFLSEGGSNLVGYLFLCGDAGRSLLGRQRD